MRKLVTALCVAIIIVVLLASVGYAASGGLDVDSVSVQGAISLRIAHVSDLHYPNNRISTEELLAAVKSSGADYVVLTGDIIDGSASKDDITSLSPFLSALSSVAPCYGVIGNHEIGSDYLDDFVAVARVSGIKMLLNQSETVLFRGQKLTFVGINDAYPYDENKTGSLKIPSDTYKILLAHRPELFPSYASAPVSVRPSLIFCGHAHGGLVRIGSISLYAPNQGLLPKYTSGAYVIGDSTMIVSRGLGYSGIDYRAFNKYHLPVVTVSPKNAQ